MKVKHLKCGYVWWTEPKRLLSQKRCPKCHYNQPYTTASFVKQVNRVYPNEFKILSQYKSSKGKILVQHLKCGHKWWIRPNNLLTGYGCPYCNQSHGERLINQVLTNAYSLKEGIDFQYAYILPNGLHLDFYLSKQRIGIEYDGEQHFRAVKYFGGTASLKKQQQRDSQKDQYCQEYQIHLIRIPYTVNTYKGIKTILSRSLSLSQIKL